MPLYPQVYGSEIAKSVKIWYILVFIYNCLVRYGVYFDKSGIMEKSQGKVAMMMELEQRGCVRRFNQNTTRKRRMFDDNKNFYHTERLGGKSL